MNARIASLVSALALLASLAAPSPALAAPDCALTADAADPRCWGALGDDRHDDTKAMQRAADNAVATDRPLLLAHGHYRLTAPLTIDYGRNAGRGFELDSEGAVLDGKAILGAATLRVVCSGGSLPSPKGCFYFHQTGTLFVDAKTSGWAVVIGGWDYADAQNSIRLDHLIVNNAGSGGGAALNYVLDSDLFIVTDTAGRGAGLRLGQVQFSTIRGAASAAGGPALQISADYVFGNTLQALDLEVSPTGIEVLPGHAGQNLVMGGTIDCPTAIVDPQHRLQMAAVGFGGDVRPNGGNGATP